MSNGIEVTDTNSIKIPQRSELFGVERKDWDRIKNLVTNLSLHTSYWQNFSFFFLGTSVSMFTALLSTGYDNPYEQLLISATIFCIILTIAFFYFDKALSKVDKKNKEAILEEMELMEIEEEVKTKEKINDFYFQTLFEDYVEDEEVLKKAREVLKENGKASTSFLQRKLRIGYSRAARIIDTLEKEGFIGPQNGSNPREILKK